MFYYYLLLGVIVLISLKLNDFLHRKEIEKMTDDLQKNIKNKKPFKIKKIKEIL